MLYRFGHECLTTTLLEYGASPAARNAEQRTALHLSCLAGHIEVKRNSYSIFQSFLVKLNVNSLMIFIGL